MKPGRTIIATAGITLLVSGIASHLTIANHNHATGVLAVLDHVFDLSLALALTAVVICVGHGLCERFRLKFSNSFEEIGVSLFVGTGVVGLAVLFFGLLGWLRPVPIASLIAICIVSSRRSWARLYQLTTDGLQSLTLTRENLPAITYLCLIVFLIVRAAAPPTAADELIYHLPVPKAFVEQGRIYPVFDNSFGNLPFLIHMIYVLCLLAGSDIAARLFSLFLAVGTSLAIYGFCNRYLTRLIAALAMFAFFGAGMVTEVATTSRIDVSLAGMLFLCTYSMVNHLDTKQHGWLWVSALLAGFSLGIKQTAFIWLAFIGVMYLVERLVVNRNPAMAVVRSGIAYALLAVAIASPWYIKNYLWFHNPNYPLFTGEVAEFGPQGNRFFDANDERRLEAHFNVVRSEMPDVVNVLEKQLTEARNSRVSRKPLLLWNFFFKPNDYLMSEPYQYPNYLFLIIPALVFVRKPKWILWLLVLSLGFVFAITATTWIARYLLPAYPTLTIVATYTLIALAERLKTRLPILERLPLYLVAAALGVVLSAGVHSIREFGTISFLTGRSSREDVISPLISYRPIHFINTNLPPDARIFILGAQLNYGLERKFVTDENWFATKWRRLLIRNPSIDEVHEDLKRQGFTHVLYSPDLFRFAALMGTQGTGGTDMISVNEVALSDEARRLGPDYQLLRNWATFTLYKRKFLETLYSDEYGYQVLKIK
jgi:4-amino-4-deoxy-L-arabinose transferase-like glycosyltransferase